MEVDYVRVIFSLLASVGLGVAVVFLMSRYGRGRLRKANTPKLIEILEIQALGNRTSLVAVSYAGQEILFVVGSQFATVALARPAPTQQVPPLL